MPISVDGVNEACFTLIIEVRSYMNPRHGYQANLWDKCDCLMSKVVPMKTTIINMAHQFLFPYLVTTMRGSTLIWHGKKEGKKQGNIV